MTLRIGYKASAEQFGPRELLEYGVLAEELGLDSVMISDHFQPWRHDAGHAPASIPWIAALAERTSRVTLGTSVLTPTFRYQPAVIAQAFATMACLAPGRIMLGVGTGESLNEAVVAGPDFVWPEFKERFARLREAVELMRALWTQDEVDFDGTYYRLRGAAIYDRPEQPVPVYVAAGGPMMARYAGRKGDGMICTSGKGAELYADKLLPGRTEGLEKAGRAPGDCEAMIEIKISYDADPQAALENTRFWAPLSLSAEQKHSIDDPREMEAAADALPLEQVAKRWIVASTPEEAVAAIEPYVRWGFTHLVVHGPGHDQRRFLRQFSDQVLPALRSLG